MSEVEQREVVLFEAALKLPAGQRAAYLSRASNGDEELRRRVERLLAAHDQSGDFLRPPLRAPNSQETVSLPTVPHEKPGDRIGRYKLLQPIGEGGCGQVYMAEQEEPVRRRVALKVIKLGLDTKQVIARFEAERQALALMDHPNIARVLDAGSTETGRPFFVMELVRGVKITEFCDANKLSTEARLGLFVRVCQAVQHAHQKGIIHRDLKPSNILVTVNDDVAVPKVIDFGIAKATGGQVLTDKTVFTAFEQFIGTPAYMSPEQALMTSVDIDTRSDVYSLGVLLYELLTGGPPFDEAGLLRRGMAEMLRVLREVEPPRPSTRLQTLTAEALTTAASLRQTEPPRLVHVVRGDLDWIVMKCLEKDRTRRYETANGLAMDVQRHLNNELVAARPPRRIYRLKKSVLRNKLVYAAGTTVVAALLGGFGFSTKMYFRERHALQSEAVAREEANRQRQAALNQSRTNRDRLIRLNVANGMKLVRDGDLLNSLPWLADALELARGDSEAERIQRLRLASVISEAPKLLRCWFQDGGASSAEFSDDGRFAATVGRDVRVWEIATGRPVLPPLDHDVEVGRARFSPDGRHLITATADGAHIWSIRDGRITTRLGHPDCEDARFSPDGQLVATAGLGGTVQIWDFQTGLLISRALKHSTVPPTSRNSEHLEFSPDSQRLLTFSFDSTACVWNARNGELLFKLEHGGVVRSAAFSPNGDRIVTSAGWAKTAHLWNAVTGEPLAPSMNHDGMVDKVAFSPDGNWVATTSFNGKAAVWNARDGSLISLIPAGGALIGCEFNADGTLLVTRQLNGSARVWFAASGQPFCPPIHRSAWLVSAHFHPDGRRLLTAGAEGMVRLWDLPGSGLAFTPWPGQKRSLISYSQRGGWVATTNDSGFLNVWNVGNWTASRFELELTNHLVGVFFSMDERRLLTVERVLRPLGGGRRFALRAWDIESGRLAFGTFVSSSIEPRGLPRFAASSDCSLLAIAQAGSVELVSLREERQLWKLTPGHEIGCMSFSPNSEQFLLSCHQHAQVVDTRTGGNLYALSNNLAIYRVEYDSKGQYVVTTDFDVSYRDGEARVWDAATGKLKWCFKLVDGMTSAAFSPDSTRLAVGAESGTARLFDLETGAPVTPIFYHNGLESVAFGGGGKLLATGGGGTACVWNPSTGEAITPILKQSATVFKVAFLGSAQWLVTQSGDSLSLWRIRSDERPLDDLVAYARLIAGSHVDQTGYLELVTPRESQAVWEGLQAKYPEDFQFSEERKHHL